jgi:tRNA threonylcarbamoyladenosine biosynthesis protein TsaE
MTTKTIPITNNFTLPTEFLSSSSEATFHYGFLLGEKLKSGSVIAFFGDLGSGKTTFVKGLAKAVAQIEPREVSSPTFNYFHVYSGSKTLYHFDLYRLKSEKEFLALGFDEYFQVDGICCLEWSEKITALLPQETIRIHFSHIEENKRKIVIS